MMIGLVSTAARMALGWSIHRLVGGDYECVNESLQTETAHVTAGLLPYPYNIGGIVGECCDQMALWP